MEDINKSDSSNNQSSSFIIETKTDDVVENMEIDMSSDFSQLKENTITTLHDNMQNNRKKLKKSHSVSCSGAELLECSNVVGHPFKSTVLASSEVRAKINGSNPKPVEFGGQTKSVISLPYDVSKSKKASAIVTAQSAVEMPSCKPVLDNCYQTSSISEFPISNVRTDLSETRQCMSLQMETQKTPDTTIQESKSIPYNGQEIFKTLQTKEYQLNSVQSDGNHDSDLKYKDFNQHGYIVPEEAFQYKPNHFKVGQKPKKFIIQRHGQEIHVKLLEETQPIVHLDKGMHQDKASIEKVSSEGQHQIDTRKRCKLCSQVVMNMESLVENVEKIHVVPGLQTSGNYQNVTQNFNQFRPLTRPQTFQNMVFQSNYGNCMNLQSKVPKANVPLQFPQGNGTIPKAVGNMSVQQSSIKNYVYVIPLINTERLEQTKLNTLKDTGATLNIPVHEITSFGLPFKIKSGNISFLNFPHDAVAEIDTDKIFRIVSSQ